MPIFELKCNKCQTVDEYIVFGTLNGVKCNGCNGKEFEKLMSSFNTVGKKGITQSGNCGGCKRTNCSTCP